MNIEVKIDTSKLDRMMADFPQAIAAAQRNALVAIGAEVASSSTRAFRDASLRPSPWAPRKSGGKHPLLIKSGALRQSIGWKLEGGDSVVVGTDKRYGGYHQTGTKKMPARPFMPVDAKGELTPRIVRKINGIVEKAYGDELRKLGFS